MPRTVDLFLSFQNKKKLDQKDNAKIFLRIFILLSIQFGFRSNHSTTSTLINCVEKRIRKSLDEGHYVFVDLQKAFDTVDHNIFFSKLNHYCI